MVSPSASPEAYTPKHLAERLVGAKAALEGERKQVTVLRADDGRRACYLRGPCAEPVIP